MTDIKTLLLAGCSVKMGYKRSHEEWVGDITICCYAGGNGIKPKVCILGNENQDYDMDDIDQAIEDFKTIAFSPKNLWYKHDEAMRQMSIDTDLDNAEDFAGYEEIRVKLIKDEK